MPPTYPHPVPAKAMPFNDAIADPNKVDKIPDLLTLTANVKAWFKAVAPGVTATSQIDFTKPGSVIVVGNA